MKKKTDGGYDIPENDLREMQEDEARELPEGLETYTGTCRFCGQMGTVNALPGWDVSQVNESVTCRCQCEKAKEYTKQKEQVQKAKARITEVFGPAAGGQALDKDIVASLYSFVDMIAEKKMQAVTLDIGRGLKARVSRMAKGSIKVERTETVKASFEE